VYSVIWWRCCVTIVATEKQQCVLFLVEKYVTVSNTNKAGNVGITVHLGAFVKPLSQWKSNEYYTTCVCICSPLYPACNAHAPYCLHRPARLYNISPHYVIKGTIFNKKISLTQK
jgi:hypothetical protein